jgi:outer membrane receptor protein involved in Fe transport
VTICTILRQRSNVDAIIAKGVEVTANASLGDFTLSGSYAYTRQARAVERARVEEPQR